MCLHGNRFCTDNSVTNYMASFCLNKGSQMGSPLTIAQLKKVLEAQYTDLPKINHTNAEEVCSAVKHLNFQFQQVDSIKLIWLLKDIEVLCLSNNLLRSTSGLESLTNLRSLDLSFNQISDISNLKNLTKLEVLALHKNNLVSVNKTQVEKLQNLRVLSLGSNQLNSLEHILELRFAPKLGSLTLHGNPCIDETYPSYIIAHIPQLSYLDYERITDFQRENSIEKYENSVKNMTENDEDLKEIKAKQLQKLNEEIVHKKAGVFGLNDDSLLKDMFKNDVDMDAMTQQAGVKHLIDRFREQFESVCFKIFEEGLANARSRDQEFQQLNDAIKEAQKTSSVVCRNLLHNFETDFKSLLESAKEISSEGSISAMDDQEEFEAKMQKATELKDMMETSLDLIITNLLDKEIVLANQIKEAFELAQSELSSTISLFLMEAAEIFDEGRRFAYSFYCRLRELTSKLVDTAQKDKSSGRVCEIFEGGDTLSAALAGVHDRHLEVMNAREKELKSHLTDHLQKELNKLYRDEWKRHRTRLEEISTLTDSKRIEISNSLPEELIDF